MNVVQFDNLCALMDLFVDWLIRVREREVSVRGGTRPTLYVLGVAAVVSTCRRVDAPPVLFPPPVSVHVSSILSYGICLGFFIIAQSNLFRLFGLICYIDSKR